MAGLIARLNALRPVIADAAQKVVDEWQLDEEGLDPELGAGGICDRVADAIIETLYAHLEGIEAAPGAPEGEDHQWVVVGDGQSAFVVDIPPGVYETGGGYAWKKIEGAEIGPQDVVIEPIDPKLAQDLLKEGGQMRRLIVLAEALEALGEANSAALVRVLTVPQLVREAQGWAERFFQANPEFMDRAERFAEAKGIDLATYLNQLDAMREDMGRRKIHQDLGYVGMGAAQLPAGGSAEKPAEKPAPKLEPKLQPETELRWPFPPPNVLQDERAFIAAALAWSMGEGQDLYARMYGQADNLRDMGKKGEIQAARAYLRHLMKDAAPRLAVTLQAKWREASAKGDREAQRTLRAWWSSLSDVWELIQQMISLVNDYEYEG
jgi:hypothetical protein